MGARLYKSWGGVHSLQTMYSKQKEDWERVKRDLRTTLYGDAEPGSCKAQL